jgi:CubicO group peptidase (beta-lactamase class C family)
MIDRRACLVAALSAAAMAPALAVARETGVDVASDLAPVRDKFGLPALAAAVAKGGTIAASGATGVRAYGRTERVTIDDRFHLGSDTKAMTATLAGMMVEAHKLDWMTTIGDALGGDTSQINPALAKVTLEQLLSHTSGIPTDNDDLIEIYFNADALKYNIVETRRRAFAKWKDRVPATPPGSAFHYANLGYMIAGMMVERAAGLSWEELIVDRIFGPLRLDTAGLGPQATIGRLDAAVGHDVEEGKITPMLWGPAADVPPLLGPAGAAHMSVLDFAAWAGWNAGAGKRAPQLVTAETLAEIHKPRIGTGKLVNPRPGTPQEGEYAFGWGLVKFEWTQAPVLTHNGSNGFNFAKIVVDVRRDLGIVAMTNITGAKAEDAASAVVESLYGRFA